MSERSNTNISIVLPHCFYTEFGPMVVYVIFISKACLHTPVFVLVLHLCYQQWRLHRSFAKMSHTDVFVFHHCVIHLLSYFATVLFFSTQHLGYSILMLITSYVSSISFPAEWSLHTLTGVEHYLAVVHPVSYLSLRHAGGVRIRNISIGCVWSLSFGWIGITHAYYPDIPNTPYFSILTTSLLVIMFCGLSVLCVLIRPGPGEMGGDSQQSGQLKLRAFNTIAAIMSVQLLCFVAMVAGMAVENSEVFSYSIGCIIVSSSNWLSLISGLVLPLLYLRRTITLPCCRGNNT